VTKNKASKSRRPSPLRNRKVMLPVAVVVLVAGYYAFTWWAEGAERAESRRKLLAECEVELARATPDNDALSRLMAGLQRLPDADTSPELLARRAEIELVRGRPERAFELFGSVAGNPTATADQARLGARILLQRSAGFPGDPSEWTNMLSQVVSLSERAFADSDDVADLFRCWQGSTRGFDEAESKRFAEQLKAQFGSTPEAQLAELMPRFNPEKDRARVRELADAFEREPVEVGAMLAMTVLGAGDVEGAVAASEKVLLRAPSVPFARYATALALHVRVLGARAAGGDDAALVKQRNQHIDWLLQRAPPTDALQAKLREMRK